MSDLNKKAVSATKWSSITEVMAKLVTPIVSMVLARVLTPEAFGVVATISMIIAFAELFADAGFQRYIIQHEFENDKEKYSSVNVAFWTNFGFSLVLWILIIIFRNQLAELVGSPGLGLALAITCAAIPIASFSSIQMALYKRDFDFKTLFYVRLVGTLIPLVITVPLALWLRNYWALLIGNLVVQVSNAVILTVKSKWKPKLFYSFSLLKQMFAFCGWVLLDSVMAWAANYFDIFLLGKTLGDYYLGLYKTSINIVGQIMGIVTAAILPVMLSTLSRTQNDIPQMRSVLLKFQKYTGLLLIPMGVGVFLYRDLITAILLGNQWCEAGAFIGIWALTQMVTILFSRFSTMVFPSIGKPQMSVVSQVLYLVFLIPAIIISVRYGYDALCATRCIIRIWGIIIDLGIVYYLIKLSPLKMFGNVIHELLGAIVMALISYGLSLMGCSMVWQFVSILICVLVYFGVLYCFTKEREIMVVILKRVCCKFKKK